MRDSEAQSISIEDTTKPLFRKISWRIMSLMLIGYFLAQVDRANVSVMYGALTTSYGLTPAQFGLAAGLFYVGYLVCEIPSNLALTRFGARLWLGRILITWGLVTILLAFAQGANSFYALRVLLGCAEAGFYPGVLYYLTKWYPPRLLGRAYSMFILSVPVSLGLGSILTASMLRLDGIWGLAGHQWVFILQGIPPVVLGLVFFLALPDNPEKATWLTREQRRDLEISFDNTSTPVSHPGESNTAINATKVALFSLIYFCMTTGFWSVTYFLPKIIQERFHVDFVHAGYIAAAQWIIPFIAIIVVGRSSTKTGDRRWHMLLSLSIATLGVCTGASSSSPGLSLLGLSLGAAGMLAATPLFWTMPAQSFSKEKSAVLIALVNAIGNLSGLVGPSVLGYLTQLTGHTRTGLYVMSGFFLVAAILSFTVDSKQRRYTRPGASMQSSIRDTKKI